MLPFVLSEKVVVKMQNISQRAKVPLYSLYQPRGRENEYVLSSPPQITRWTKIRQSKQKQQFSSVAKEVTVSKKLFVFLYLTSAAAAAKVAAAVANPIWSNLSPGRQQTAAATSPTSTTTAETVINLSKTWPLFFPFLSKPNEAGVSARPRQGPALSDTDHRRVPQSGWRGLQLGPTLPTGGLLHRHYPLVGSGDWWLEVCFN